MRERETLSEELKSATQAIKDALGGDDSGLLYRLETAYGAGEIHAELMLIERICAHLPGVAPAIRLIYQHVTEAPSDRALGCCERLPID